jgi:hypothetical protein
MRLWAGLGASWAWFCGSSTKSRLHADTRGAIMVVGILIGAMLVSVLFHIASVGQAILWREQAQDAADQVGYEAALWNARGMNVIVAMNIFLVVLIALLMFWRLVLLVIWIMLALCGIACVAQLIPGLQFLDVLCDQAPRLVRVVRRMVDLDRRYTPKLYRAMTLIHRGQVIVSSATPIISAVKSSLHVTSVYRDNGVEVALGIGPQLLPYKVYPKSKEDADKPSGSPMCGVTHHHSNARLSGYIMGKPVSLPWEHWFEVDEMCGKGGEMQFKIVGGMVHHLADVLGFPELGAVGDAGPWKNIWSFIAESLSPLLCEDLEGTPMERLEETIDKVCKDRDDRDKCEDDMRKQSTDGADGADGPKLGQVKSDDVLYAKPYWLAQNGNFFMQSWGLVLAKRPGIERADRLITFSNRFGGKKDPVKVEDEAWVVAGAEMFYDCGKGWGDCQYSVPWGMNWRARLRRFHDPTEYASGVLETYITETVFGSLDRALGGGPIGNFIHRITGGNKTGSGLNGFATAQVHTLVLSLARQELTMRARASVYQWGGIRNAGSWVTDHLGAGHNDVIH